MSNQQKEHQKSRNEIFGVPLISICLADKANTTSNAIAVDIAFFILLYILCWFIIAESYGIYRFKIFNSIFVIKKNSIYLIKIQHLNIHYLF